MTALPVYVITCDRYRHLIPAWKLMVDKYWPGQKLIFLGYTFPEFPMPEGFTFVSLGQETTSWTDGMRPFFENQQAGDHFIILLDDLILRHHVDTLNLDRLELAITKGVGGLGQIDKAVLHTLKNRSAEPYQDLLLIWPDSDFRTSSHPCIWRREYFLTVLHEGYTIWDFEIRNMEQVQTDGSTYIAANTDMNIIPVCNIYHRQRLAFQGDKAWKNIPGYKDDPNRLEISRAHAYHRIDHILEEDKRLIMGVINSQ